MPGPWQIVLILVTLGLLVLPIVALVDVLTNKFPGSLQAIWVLVILILPLFGLILYYVIGRKQRLNK